MRTILRASLAFYVAVCASALPAAWVDEPGFYTLTEELVTPHIAWAKPYALGEIKALVIGADRQIIELSQRLGLRYTPVITAGTEGLGVEEGKVVGMAGVRLKDFTPEDKEAEIRERLRDQYDVIILGVKWDQLPADLQLALLKKVAGGTGLLAAGPARERKGYLARAYENVKALPEDRITAGVPFAGLPVFRQIFGTPERFARNAATTSTLHSGRLVWLNYPTISGMSLTPQGQVADTCLAHEYEQSLIIKALLWAAKKEPPICVRTLAPHLSAVPDGISHAQGNIRIGLFSSAEQSRPCTIRIVDRMEDSPAEYHTESRSERAGLVRPGENTFDCELSRLKDGMHFLDVFILDGETTIAWASGPLEVKLPVRMDAIVLEQAEIRRGQPVRGKTRFNRPLPGGVRVKTSLWDTYGRLMEEQNATVPANALEWPFSFHATHPLGQVLTVRAVLMRDETVLQKMRREVLVAKFGDFDYDDFHTVAWTGGFAYGPYNYWYHHQLKQMQAEGFDVNYTLGVGGPAYLIQENGGKIDREKPAFIARHNLRQVPYLMRFNFSPHFTSQNVKNFDPKTRVRQPCLTDPVIRSRLEGRMAALGELYARYGAVGYSLGDENLFIGFRSDVCLSPTCRAFFRDYLRLRYSSLDELNRQWTTSFASWEEVLPDTYEEALRRGNPSSWIDHRLCMENVWTDTLKFAVDVLRRHDPDARVGLEGDMWYDRHYTGYNWWDLMRIFGFCFPYEAREPVRSFARKGSFIGAIMGTTNHTREKQKYQPWNLLFRGFNGAMWYHARFSFNPDGTFTNAVRWALPEIGEIRSGPAKALLTGQRRDDKVAIHYSRTSVYAELFGPRLSAVCSASQGFEAWLEDANIGYTYVSSIQVEDGELTRKGYKILFLPYSLALSNREAAEIDRFVSLGGVVIADFLPGVTDEHGRKRDEGILNGVFGVTETAGENRTAEPGGVVVDGNTGWLAMQQAALPFQVVDRRIRVSAGQALGVSGQSPCVVVNEHGKGKALLLNFAVHEYLSFRANGETKTAVEFVKRVLAAAGVEEFAQIRDSAGQPLSACLTAVVENGPILYFGILRDYTVKGIQPERATVILPRPYHVYDVRSREFLGVTSKITTTIDPGVARLFALLPYEVTRITLKVSPARPKPGDQIVFSGQVGGTAATGAHVVRMDVLDSGDRPCAWYGRNLLTKNGTFSGSLPTARNEKGVYRLRITDVISGKTAEAGYDLR